MTRPESQDLLRALLAEVDSDRPLPEGPHVADDDDLLARWSAGYLDKEESERVVRHLAACRECSLLVAHMIQVDALAPPLPADEPAKESIPTVAAQMGVAVPPATVQGPHNSGATTKGQGTSFGGRSMWFALLAAAATVVLAVLYFGQASRSIDGQIALADGELAQGASEQALARIEAVLSGSLTSDQRARALATAENAAAKVGLDSLAKGQFDAVQDVVGRAEKLGVASDTLANVDLQAARKSASQLSLEGSATLFDYGYNAVGESTRKGFLEFTQEFERQSQAWKRAIAAHPRSTVLRLNYGQFLLESGLSGPALAEFQAVLNVEPSNLLAQRGSALAHFARQDYSQALKVIESIIQSHGESAADLINAAISCEALQRGDDAIRYWRQARDKVSDSHHRALIDERLEAAGAK